MIYSLFLPVCLFLLAIVQITILDLVSFGRVEIEISVIVIIYAGFHFNVLHGSILSLLIGFYLDCLTSTIFGLHMVLYMVIYGLSRIVGKNAYAGKPGLIAFFSGSCALLEGVAIILLYRFVFGSNLLHEIPKILVPRAIAVGLLSPVLFSLFQRFEVFLNVEDRRPDR